jgi:hypothetical protein
MKKYKYVGDGMGVPGLPHEISDEEVEALGVTELLKAALENGSYVEAAIVDLPVKPEHVAPFLGEEERETRGEESVSEQTSNDDINLTPTPPPAPAGAQIQSTNLERVAKTKKSKE